VPHSTLEGSARRAVRARGAPNDRGHACHSLVPDVVHRAAHCSGVNWEAVSADNYGWEGGRR
jgi:hypothetical protein